MGINIVTEDGVVEADVERLDCWCCDTLLIVQIPEHPEYSQKVWHIDR